MVRTIFKAAAAVSLLGTTPLAAATIINIAPTSGSLTFDTLTAGDDLTNNGPFSSNTLNAFIFDEGTAGSAQTFLLHFDRNGGVSTTVKGTFDILLSAGDAFTGTYTTKDDLLASDPNNGVIYQTTPGLATDYRGFEPDDLVVTMLNPSTVHVSYKFVNGTTHALDEARFNINTAPVPEPATWAMMLGGFALTGAAVRRRRAVGAVAA